jgi:transcriptional regulator with PAS, ATPase and Fis domain
MKNCLICKKEFIPHIRNPYQIYCSKTCGTKAGHQRAVETGRKALNGKLYRERHPERKKEQDRNYLNNYRYGGNQYKVLERDNYTCTQCGSTKRNSLVVHHMDEVIENTSMENLITLCRACHAKHHHAGELNVKFKPISKEDVEKAMESTSNLEDVAKLLGITRATLRKKRKMYGLPDRDSHGRSK